MKKIIFVLIIYSAFSSCIFSNKKKEDQKPIAVPMEIPKDTNHKQPKIREAESDKTPIGAKAGEKLVKPPTLDTIAVH